MQYVKFVYVAVTEYNISPLSMKRLLNYYFVNWWKFIVHRFKNSFLKNGENYIKWQESLLITVVRPRIISSKKEFVV